MARRVKSEEAPQYGKVTVEMGDDLVIQKALQILEARVKKGPTMAGPEDLKNYLRLQLTERQWEVFGVVTLDNRHRVIRVTEIFRGTIDGASVHPREVVREVYQDNAAAVVFFHNHPSGVAKPSRADELLTRRLKDALTLIDVRVLDHLIVGDREVVSFAEMGLI